MKTRGCMILDLRGVIKKDTILIPRSVEHLEETFRRADIDWSNWTTPPSSLFKRVVAKESTLVSRNGKGLTIVAENVAIKVFRPLTTSTIHLLWEKKQISGGNETVRETKHTAVIRKITGESHTTALIRCLAEKLRMEPKMAILANPRPNESFIHAAFRIWKEHRSNRDAFVVFEDGIYPENDPASLQGLPIERRYYCFRCVMPECMPQRLPGYRVVRRTHEDKKKTVFYEWDLYDRQLHNGSPHLD